MDVHPDEDSHLLHFVHPLAEPLELGTQTNGFLLQLLLIIQTL